LKAAEFPGGGPWTVVGMGVAGGLQNNSVEP
jgi:hypothetical protein